MFDLFGVSEYAYEICLMMLGWCWKVMLNAFGLDRVLMVLLI